MTTRIFNALIGIWLFVTAFMWRHTQAEMTVTIVAAILTFALAILSWHLYEKHFLKLKRFFEYRATTLREPVRDAVVPPPAEVPVEIGPTSETPSGQPIVG